MRQWQKCRDIKKIKSFLIRLPGEDMKMNLCAVMLLDRNMKCEEEYKIMHVQKESFRIYRTLWREILND